MANPEHLAKLKKGVKAWNRWREANPMREVDLRGADLAGSDLRLAHLWQADFSGANLSSAKLKRAILRASRFVGADLKKASLESADLSFVDLSKADLRDASLFSAILTAAKLNFTDLRCASLIDTTFRLAEMNEANFEGATVFGTAFSQVDLSVAKGLENVKHTGRCVVDIQTIYQSKGKIPLRFLRGAGIPEGFIESMPHFLAPGATQFSSCFISYSTKDQEFANRLYTDLQNKGVRCWFAPHDVQGGKNLHQQLDDAIRMHERLLLILSSDSIKSPWVEMEIRKARKRERTEKRRVLFPISLVPFEAIREWEIVDADEGRDLATEIREFYIPDFSAHNSYAREFEKLLRDLRTQEPKS
jgi:TIR domain/Pentapeptide repeats (8 copies)